MHIIVLSWKTNFAMIVKSQPTALLGVSVAARKSFAANALI
jgi:hypothetical protein